MPIVDIRNLSTIKYSEMEDNAVYAPILSKVFDRMKCHSSISDKEDRRDTAYFICNLSIVPGFGIRPLEEVPPERILRLKASSSSAFYDDAFPFSIKKYYLFYNNNPEDTIVIYAGDKVAGFYIKSTNTLIATDWTHRANRKNKEIVQSFVDYVQKNFGIAKDDERFIPYLKEDEEITMGLDPEFELLEIPDDYHVLNASDEIGYSDSSELGTDGSGYQVEIRPDPATTPEGVVENIKKILEKARRPLSVRGEVYPLGGHIHLGIPETTPIKPLVKLLDDFIGRPLQRLEGSRRGGYSGLGKWRYQDWGIEYRTPPSGYLVDPELTRITFKIVKGVVEKLLKTGVVKYIRHTRGDKLVRKEDYLQFITEDEYNKFMSFISRDIEQYPISINAAWHVPEGAEPVLDIEFAIGDYEKDLSDYIKKYIEDRIQKVDRSFKVRFFGLRKDRGNVFFGEGLEPQVSDDFGNTKYTTSSGRVRGLRYGLSWYSRYEDKDELNRVLEIIVQKIKEYTGGAK